MRVERIGGGAAEVQLARALAASARGAGASVTIGEHRSRPWASATFVGARHRLVLTGPRAWIGGLPEADLTLRGHLLADLAILAIDGDADATAQLEALTIEAD